MSVAACKCGRLIDTDADPESYYFETPEGQEIELEQPMCGSCKDEKFAQLENKEKDRL